MSYSRLQRLGTYLRPHWRAISLGVVALFAVNALGVYIPLLIRDSIDDLRQAFASNQVLPYVVLILALASLMWVMRMLSRLIIFGVGRQVEFELKQSIFQHLLSLEPAYFARNTIGDLMNRATSDVDNVRRLVGFALLSIINTAFAYGLTLPVMFGIDLPLSLAAIAIYPLMLLITQLFSGKLQAQQLAVQEKLSDLSDLIQEDMSGMAAIKTYAQEENECRAFNVKNRQLLAANLKLAQTRNFLFPLIEGLSYISLLVLLAMGTGAIEGGAITIGDFIALLILVERLVFPTALLGFTITTYQRGEVSIDRLETVLQAQPQIREVPQAIPLPLEAVRGEITASHLSYTYPGSSIPALKDVSFSIGAGETVAIVGPVGSGKSTLAKALPRLLDISLGQLFLDGRDVTQLRLADLRRAIACVPQDSFLFSTSIQNNICYGEPLNGGADMELVAGQAQIQQEIRTFPQQYATTVGERGITLSGGQRQRMALARALLVDAPVLILDDALSSVDNQTAAQILSSLSQERQKTILFISHQLSAAAQADRIFVIERGAIVQVGTHAELLAVPGLYQTLWQYQQLEENM